MIQYGGLLIVFFAVYAQTGLFFCFFIPSGAFLFTGGMFVATGQLQNSIFTFVFTWLLLVLPDVLPVTASGLKPVLSYTNGKIQNFANSIFALLEFYNKYGQFALTIGTSFPVIRTFSPVFTGIIKMQFSRFVF